MMSPTNQSSRSAFRITAWVVFGVTLALVVSARLRLLGLPLERDEGEYAYTGQLILHGIAPYQLAYSMKFPGTSAAYALTMLLFGESGKGIHLGLIAINLITVGLIFYLGRKLLGEIPGVAAAAAYGVLSLMPHVLGTAAHATHYVALFGVAGMALLIQTLDRRSTTMILASGCLFGLAMLMKQPGLIFALFGVAYLFAHDYRARLKAGDIVRHLLFFVLGVGAPLIITCLFLWKAGVFRRFWFWTVQYAAQYGSQVSLADGIRIFGGHFFGALGTAWPIWIIAVIGLVACVLTPTLRARAGFLITLTVFSAMAICPGLYFRPHYFILLLPAISLLAGTAVAAGFQCAGNNANKARLMTLLLFTACLGWPLWSEAEFFFQRPLPEANRMINGVNPFPESIRIGEYIREHSNPSDTIAVLGSEPQIYFYAGRLSATGYIYTYGLMEPQPYAHRMQQEMIDEIETARPKFLVLVVIKKSWLAGRDSDLTVFRWADSYCNANYEEVGLVNITDQGTDYYLSGRPPNVMPTAEHISIYRRKT